jgi:hypothetical protein
MNVVLSNRPTEQQQAQILELFLAGHSARRIPNMLNFDVSFEGVELTLRAALNDLRDYARTLRDTLEGMQ